MSTSVFTKIINRELPAHIIHEDEKCIVILDAFPSVVGQSLVIPKKEDSYAFDLDDETYTHIFAVAKMIATASDKAFNTVRTCLVVEGFDVPHVHIKLYPMTTKEPALGNLLPTGTEASKEALEAAATQLMAAIDHTEG